MHICCSYENITKFGVSHIFKDDYFSVVLSLTQDTMMMMTVTVMLIFYDNDDYYDDRGVMLELKSFVCIMSTVGTICHSSHESRFSFKFCSKQLATCFVARVCVSVLCACVLA